MARKKESTSSLSEEENAQLQLSLEQFHRIADELHASTNKEEAEAALGEINAMGEATQMALLKALSKEHESDAADIALALNELSPNKSVRKEARRTLIRMEEARLYPQWKPPVVRTPVASIPVSHPPRFWRGYITQAREEGEIQLILCWEQGFDYGDVRMFIFLVDFSLFNQLVMDAEDVGEDRGLTFINPNLEMDEVAATFVGAWSLGDFGLTYDLLANDSPLREGLERDEWIERHHSWANEARPSRFELGFVREREASIPALWLPSSVSSRGSSSRKEVEVGWSIELSDTQLSGTLPEMPMGTTVNKETGRHWFWTSYTSVREQEGWRIRQMTDEGARAQGLSTVELQERIKGHNERVNEILQQNPGGSEKSEVSEELIWRIIHTLHYDDALIAHFPLDRTYYGDAYTRSIGIGALERAVVYLEKLARNFAEQRGSLLRQLAITQASLGEYYRERGMVARGEQFAALAEASIRESLALQNDVAGHAVLAELLMRQGDKLDEAESELQLAKELAVTREEEAMIENNLGNLAVDREELEEALRHYQRVVEIEPNFEGIWFKIGFMQRNLERFEEAKATYLHAIEREPKDMAPYSELCAIYMNERELGKAREIVERGLQNIPGSPRLLALLSSIYMESGNLRRAQLTLNEAEQIDPNIEIVQSMREELNRRLKR
ncbi:MAG: hypothetical protein E6I91_00065 [Chloroflexi bacterium]|nr:MAG: hypothetical protein E6I91_00065 [Chloroflexota bacterium]